MSEFVSYSAFVLWEKNLKEKDFIVGRGFNKLISPFIKVIEKRGWHLLYEHKAPGFVALAKEFYVNMVGVREKTVYVRGEWISFNREKITETFNLKLAKRWVKVQEIVKRAKVSENYRLAHKWKREMEVNKDNPI